MLSIVRLNRNFDSMLDVAIVIVFNWIDKPQYYATLLGASVSSVTTASVLAIIHISNSEQSDTNANV